MLALKRQGMVGANGVMALTLNESFVQFARPGINRVMLGGGATYTNFALGTTVDLQAGFPQSVAGCGLVFRFANETDYTLAFIDQSGGYGVSRRNGDTFAPGLYGENSAFAGGGRHHLLLIADGDTLYYYVDRQLVGSLENDPHQGQVGIAVVNFEGVTTSCNYSGFWLWRWE